MNIKQVLDWKVKFLKGGCEALRGGVHKCIKFLNTSCTKIQTIDSKLAKAIEVLSAEEICLVSHLLENYRNLTEKQFKEIQAVTNEERKECEETLRRKKLLIEAECSTLDYGIEEKMHSTAEPINISTAIENQISCIIDKNEGCEVKTSNIEEKRTEAKQESAPTVQSAQALKEDMSGIIKNREKPSGIYTVWD